MPKIRKKTLGWSAIECDDCGRKFAMKLFTGGSCEFCGPKCECNASVTVINNQNIIRLATVGY